MKYGNKVTLLSTNSTKVRINWWPSVHPLTRPVHSQLQLHLSTSTRTFIIFIIIIINSINRLLRFTLHHSVTCYTWYFFQLAIGYPCYSGDVTHARVLLGANLSLSCMPCALFLNFFIARLHREMNANCVSTTKPPWSKRRLPSLFNWCSSSSFTATVTRSRSLSRCTIGKLLASRSVLQLEYKSQQPPPSDCYIFLYSIHPVWIKLPRVTFITAALLCAVSTDVRIICSFQFFFPSNAWDTRSSGRM